MNFFKGSSGGRVYPLWGNAASSVPNIKPEIVQGLIETLGIALTTEDVFAYLAAVAAHPNFTKRFAADLVRPSVRLPVTSKFALFLKGAEIGKRLVWLHSFGERFVDAVAGRPFGSPRLPKSAGLTIPVGGAIPGAPEPLPDEMTYDPVARRLHVGKGHIDGVSPEMWSYEVSGKNVLRQWFSYRKLDRSRPMIGDRRTPSNLEKIQPASWPNEYTTDLMDLLHVLGLLVLLENEQTELLEQILGEPLLTVADLGLVADNSDDSENGDSDG